MRLDASSRNRPNATGVIGRPVQQDRSVGLPTAKTYLE